jgi:Skp family chaperone for outer membrane proteins
MEKYPDEADAVINVQTEQNSIGTIVTVTGEVVELRQGHTVECAMRKAPGVMNTAAAIAAGGLLGAVAGGLITGGTTGMMGGGAVGAGSVGTYMAVKEHLKTQREQAQLKSLLDTQQTEIAHLLAKRSSLRKCAADEIPYANCKIDDTIAAASDSAKPADAPSYETEQQQFELQKQIQEQRAYIQKLRDQVFELQQQLGGYSAKTPQ